MNSSARKYWREEIVPRRPMPAPLPISDRQLALPAPNYRAIEQPFLFSPDIVKEMTKAEARGEYTAERLKVRRPEAYRAIIELRGLDWGYKRIARLLGLDHRTVGAVDDAEPEAIEIERRRMSRRLRRVANLLLERLEAHPDLVPIHVAGLVIGQLVDKAELLDGRATVRSERVERIDIYSDWEAFVEKELPAGSVRELENPIPPPGTGLAGERKLSNGSEPIEVPDCPAADQESDGSARQSQASPTDVTGNDPDRVIDQADRQPTDRPQEDQSGPASRRPEAPRGGGSRDGKTINPTIDTDPQKFYTK